MTGLLIHAPTSDALKRALSNAKNFQAANPNIPVEIIANGTGAKVACDIVTADLPQNLLICENSIKAQKLTLPENAKTVPAAIVYLYEKQQAGWSYVRA